MLTNSHSIELLTHENALLKRRYEDEQKTKQLVEENNEMQKKIKKLEHFKKLKDENRELKKKYDEYVVLEQLRKENENLVKHVKTCEEYKHAHNKHEELKVKLESTMASLSQDLEYDTIVSENIQLKKSLCSVSFSTQTVENSNELLTKLKEENRRLKNTLDQKNG